jgi:hypothetical protein
MRGRSVVANHVNLESAGLGLKLDPVDGGGAPDKQQFVLVQIEENAVPDHVAVITAGHHLLGLAGPEIGEAVDRTERHKALGVGSLDGQFRHVVRLVKQHRAVAPGVLLVAPIGKLARNHRINVRPYPRVAQQLNGILNGLQEVF